VLLEDARHGDGLGHRVAAVGVGHEVEVGPDGGADGLDLAAVDLGALADLELHRGEAGVAVAERGLGQVVGRQPLQHGGVGPHLRLLQAAEQRVAGDPERLAGEVVEGDVDAAHRLEHEAERVPARAHERVHAVPEGRGVEGVRRRSARGRSGRRSPSW
jgi:hypothetical protein